METAAAITIIVFIIYPYSVAARRVEWPSKPENKRVRAGLVPETGYCRLQPALAQSAQWHEARKPALKFPCNLQGLRNGNVRGGHGFGYHVPY
jgi:hypothetical protein